MNATDCQLCAADTGELDFAKVCCRVRYLLRMPTRQARADWLDRWSKSVTPAVMAEIKAELVRRFNEMKKGISA